jgi:uncharacterized Zn finger protein
MHGQPPRPDDAPILVEATGDGGDRNRRGRNRKRGKGGRGNGDGQPQQQPQHQQQGRQGGRQHNNNWKDRNRGNQQQNNRNVRRVRPPGREDAEITHAQRDERLRHEGNWWADRWLGVLHRFGWKNRLANGRMYAADGRVTNFSVETGKIKARVQGTRTQPYDVTIGLKPLLDTDWDLVVDIMSCQALFTAQLLAGDMPLDVEEAFDCAYAPLFPVRKEDIQAHCSCPDWAIPCKHIAAVYFTMADAFDKDPFLIFQLRGRDRDALIKMLRQQRAAEAAAGPMQIEMIDAGSLEPFRFWQAGEELEGVHVTIAPPQIPGGTAKRLGRPPFWRSPADPITRLGEVYEAIARRAREVALNEALAGLEV